MSKLMRIMSGALIAAAIVSGAHAALAGNMVTSGVATWWPARPPGLVFGISPQYLLMRRYTAVNGLGTVSRGTPQPPPAPPRRSTVLARAAREMTPSLASAASEMAGDRIASGTAAFSERDYSKAIEEWSNECAAGAPNPVLELMLGQAYFAAKKFSKAAAATHSALCALPEDRWSIVLSNRDELYDNPRLYSFQVHQLAESVEEHPGDPALRFLLAYHYAYCGYPGAALQQLNQAGVLEPGDEVAAALRAALQPDLAGEEAPVITPGGTTLPKKPRFRRSRNTPRAADLPKSADDTLATRHAVGRVRLRGVAASQYVNNLKETGVTSNRR